MVTQVDAQHPISPVSRPVSRQSADTALVDDSVLNYPGAAFVRFQPLFPSTLSNAPKLRQVVQEHIYARRTSDPVGNYPSEDEYLLVATFKEDMYRHFVKNPKKWLGRERAQLVADSRARKAHLKDLQPKPPAPHLGTTAAAKPSPMLSATAPQHQDKIAKKKLSKPRSATRQRPQVSNSSVLQHAPRREAAAKSANKPKNRDYKSIDSYCPPLETLDRFKPRELDGGALDLSDDPLKGLLHAVELPLAANNKFNCETYLYCKRRIFHERLAFYHEGKDFKKTHAQNACNVDVNKASRLHVEFEKWGWFQPEWMSNFPRVERWEVIERSSVRQ